MTLTYMQDIYQLKKKVKILEEEFVIQDDLVPSVKDQLTVTSNDTEPIHEILKARFYLYIVKVSLWTRSLDNPR